MKWRIDFSINAYKFIEKQNVKDKVIGELRKLILKLKGDSINVNLKKLEGEWKGYYRLRKGKIRIIFEINTGKKVLYVERVDFRGNVYK
ncbi:MAG: hypothetical protein A2Y62_16480 [Candidatus Fischerbacteria bacterium RBG_13_37_8]|uniref:Addiction module toxin RelE n=1 Tax=Candidatus Fischerbacteria bacterium RBG_13_37_8 TaxID=1817863 RepID=A0A1F5VJG3_9BACT|nr:MAG: hypothetical protein A2Y62_16480 [Candidatus Fischerbacteria bacterium RBG_13_37_8]